MLSKNNYQERLRKMDDKQERFSIRKFSVGAASVLVGTAVLSMQNVQVAHAGLQGKVIGHWSGGRWHEGTIYKV